MAKVKLHDWNVLDYLKTEEDMALYLEAAYEEGGVDFFLLALGDVARAKGVADLSNETGITRNGIYRALKPGANPTLATVSKVMGALDMRFSVVPSNEKEHKTREITT
jgi:probable addiction module antidote protein